MAVVPNPNKEDRRNRTCTHFRIILHDRKEDKKLPTETFIGTRAQAEDYERKQLEKLGRGTFTAKKDRPTVKGICTRFMDEQDILGNCASTKAGYRTVFDCHLTPYFTEDRDVATITRANFREFLKSILSNGGTPHTVDRVRRYASILFNFAIEEEIIENNPVGKFRQPKKKNRSPKVKRGAYTETEMQAIIAASSARERAMIGLLCFTGIRPGELYALRYLDLNLPEQCARISRSWDYRGKVMSSPKTQAGVRTISLSAWVIAQVEEYRLTQGEALDSEALIFPSRKGTPLNPSNVRRDLWLPLIERAKVKHLDMYSLRHTFATFARASGVESFNVSRHIGHARSVIVDTIYAETLPSGLVGMSDRVTLRALGEGKTPDNTPPAGNITQPLHQIFPNTDTPQLSVCFQDLFSAPAANDERINRAPALLEGDPTAV